MVKRYVPAPGGSGTNPKKPPRSRGGVTAGGKKFTAEQAKLAFIDYISSGYNIDAACERVERSRKTYEYWRKNDPAFRAKADAVMATRKVSTTDRDENRTAARAMGFAAWRWKYLGRRVEPHQQQWVDVLEGRDPSNLHPAQTYEKHSPTRLVVNVPPNHGKTTTLTIDYATFRIVINPSIKIALVSKGADMAKDMLAGVKTQLTHPDHIDLIRDFAPEGGFEATSEEWSSSRIRLSASDRDAADKDPTIQALGMGSHIYGKRLDLVLADDVVDTENAQEWKKQLKWLTLDVASRPGMSGRIVVIGTRIAPGDLYSQLRKGDNFQSGRTPWTYLSQPVLLEDDPDPENWVTLWPQALTSWWTLDDPCPCGTYECQFGNGDGTYPRFDGKHLALVREGTDIDVWAQAYMQLDIQGVAAFPQHALSNSTNKARRHGKDGGLASVPADLYVIGSLDPATTGAAAFTVGAVDRFSGKRFLYDAWNVKHPTPEGLKDRLKAITNEFSVNEWRIEKTGLLTMFTQDFELNQWLAARGVRLTGHYTGKNKHDVSFGVGSMSPLFGIYELQEDGIQKEILPPLLELPRQEGDIQTLVAQLGVWTPDTDPKKTPIDMVMALWFFEIGCRDYVKGTQAVQRPRKYSRMASPRDRARATVVDLQQYRRTS